MEYEDKPFDRKLGRLRRARAVRSGRDAAFLDSRAADELIDRLALVARGFSTALDLSSVPILAERLRGRGIEVAEGIVDDLPAVPGQYDLVTSVGLLDTVNDLPGALALIRRALKPDGLFLAAFAGAGSLPALRRAMRAAEAAQGLGAAPRIHPQIDVRAAGDLLLRAGFALPMADRDVVEVRYAAIGDLVADLRAMGATNRLADRSRRPILRSGFAAAAADFAAGVGVDGKTVERFEILYLSGWSPA